nr:hypothetical protein [uncultured Sulfurimonas sp.]
MNLSDNILTIDTTLDNEAINQLSKDMLLNIDEIKEIVIDDSKGIASSAVFALLCSVQKTNPDIKISLLNKGVSELNGIGLMSLNIG